MANSKDRRKRRRQYPSGGIPAAVLSPQQTPSRNPSDGRAQIRSRIPSRGYALIGYALIVVIAILGWLALYPWLTVRENLSGSPSSQPPTPFVLVNRGYVPVTNLSAACSFTSTSPSVTAQFNDKDVLAHEFADALAHQGNVGIPCAQRMFDDPSRSLFQFDSDATLDVAVSYRLLGVLVHSRQRFRFRVQKTTSGQFRWAYTS